MSGGHFDYNQHKIQSIYEDIQEELDRQGKLKPKEELWNRSQYYDEYPEDKIYYTYPPEVQEEFKKGIAILKQAYVYTQRIDWLLSGDDGEETFLERLEEDLNKL